MLIINARQKGSIEYMRKLIKAYEKEKLFNAIKKMPKDQPNILLPKPFLATETSDNPIIKDWYSWRVENWGTKWDISKNGDGFELEDFENQVKSFLDFQKQSPNIKLPYDIEVHMYFNTAWSPPIEVLNATTFNKHIKSFELNYFESGQGYIGTCDSDYGNRNIDLAIPTEVASDYDALRTWLEDELSANSLSEELVDRFNIVDIYYTEQEEESFETK